MISSLPFLAQIFLLSLCLLLSELSNSKFSITVHNLYSEIYHIYTFFTTGSDIFSSSQAPRLFFSLKSYQFSSWNKLVFNIKKKRGSNDILYMLLENRWKGFSTTVLSIGNPRLTTLHSIPVSWRSPAINMHVYT